MRKKIFNFLLVVFAFSLCLSINSIKANAAALKTIDKFSIADRECFEFDSLSELSDITGVDTDYYIENGKLVILVGSSQQIRFRRNVSSGTAITVTLGATAGDAWAYGTNANLDVDAWHLIKNGAFVCDADVKGDSDHTVTLIAKDDFGGFGINFSNLSTVYIERVVFNDNNGIYDFSNENQVDWFDTFGKALTVSENALTIPITEDGNQRIRFNRFIPSGTKISLTLGTTSGDAWVYGTDGGGNAIAGILDKNGTVDGDTSIKGDDMHSVVVTSTRDMYGLIMSFANVADVRILAIKVGVDDSYIMDYIIPEYDENLEMTIGAWNGSYTVFTQENINDLKNTGINVLVGNVPTDSVFLDKIKEAGISVIPFYKDWNTKCIDFSLASQLEYFEQDAENPMEKLEIVTLSERVGLFKRRYYNALHIVTGTNGAAKVLRFHRPLAKGTKLTIDFKSECKLYAYGLTAGNGHDTVAVPEVELQENNTGRHTVTFEIQADTTGLYLMFQEESREAYIYSISVASLSLPSYIKNEAVLGMCVYDEPSLAQLEEVGLTQSTFKTLLENKAISDKVFFVNLLPDYAFADLTAYEEYVNTYFEKMTPDIISFDYYALNNDGSVRNTLFSNLDMLANKARDNNIPLWFTLLTSQHGDYVNPTESQLRWQAAVAMTFGVKGIMHYTYSGDSDHNGLMIESDGQWVKNNELFAKVSKIDNEIALWDNIYMSFERIGTGTVGSHVMFDGLTAFSALTEKGAIETATSDNALLIGTFKDINGNYGYMLTGADNPTLGKTTTVNLSFGHEYRGCMVIKNGVRSIVNIFDASTISIAAGEGVFIIPLK